MAEMAEVARAQHREQGTSSTQLKSKRTKETSSSTTLKSKRTKATASKPLGKTGTASSKVSKSKAPPEKASTKSKASKSAETVFTVTTTMKPTDTKALLKAQKRKFANNGSKAGRLVGFIEEEKTVAEFSSMDLSALSTQPQTAPAPAAKNLDYIGFDD